MTAPERYGKTGNTLRCTFIVDSRGLGVTEPVSTCQSNVFVDIKLLVGKFRVGSRHFLFECFTLSTSIELWLEFKKSSPFTFDHL